MTHDLSKALGRVLCFGLFGSVMLGGALANAQCWIKKVIVNGTGMHAPRHAKVRVELVYPKRRPGESGEEALVDGKFSIPVEFLTQNSNHVLLNIPVKCNHKPTSVVVTLMGGRSRARPRVAGHG